MNTLGKRIRELRTALNLTQEELAFKLGYTSRATINKIEMGINDITQSKIIAFAKALGTTPSYLMGWTEEKTISKPIQNIFPIEKRKFPMLGNIACGQPLYADEDRECYVSADTDIDADFCLRAVGDSMVNARICDGDIVFIRKQEMVENGEIAAVLIDDEATLKRVFYYPKSHKLVLQAENPRYEPLVYVGEELNDVRILGKAIAFQSDVV